VCLTRKSGAHPCEAGRIVIGASPLCIDAAEGESMGTSKTSGGITRPLRKETPLLLPVPEAARLLGVGATFAWELVHNGQLPSVRLGRRVLVPRAALEQLASSANWPQPAEIEGRHIG